MIIRLWWSAIALTFPITQVTDVHDSRYESLACYVKQGSSNILLFNTRNLEKLAVCSSHHCATAGLKLHILITVFKN